MTPASLKLLARERLKEAKILYGRKRYDGAAYLCGYAIELALKCRICKTLNWTEYKIGEDYKSFRIHKLAVLLDLSGLREKISTKYLPEWSAVLNWNSEFRYEPIGHIKPAVAKDMIEATQKLLRVL